MFRYCCSVMIAFLSTVTMCSAWTVLPGKCAVFQIGFDETEQVVFMNLESGGYWKSQDSGQTWIGINDNVSTTNYPIISEGVAIHDAGADTVVFRSFFTEYPSLDLLRQQISLSVDGGETWIFPSEQNNANISQLMVIDREYPNRLIYLSTSRAKYTEYFDGPWTEFQYDWAANQKFAIIQDKVNDSLFYASTFYDSFYDSGIFRSRDKGESWEPLLEEGQYFTENNDVAIYDIVSLSNTELLAAIPEVMHSNTNVSGFLRSGDYGDTWVEEYPSIPNDFWAVEIQEFPNDNGHLLIRGLPVLQDDYRIVLESFDYGHTFSTVPWDTSGQFGNPTSLTANPYNGDMFITTRGNGVWYTQDNGVTWAEFPAPEFGSLSNFIIHEDFISHVPQFGGTVFVEMNEQEPFEFRYPSAPLDSTSFAFPATYVSNDTVLGLQLRRSRESSFGNLYTMLSTDRGQSWSDPINTVEIGDQLGLLPWGSYTDDMHTYIWINTKESINQSWKLLLTTDYGRTWSTYFIPNGIYAYRSRYFVDDGYLYASHQSEGVFRTPLDGGGWEDLEYPAPDWLKAPGTTVFDHQTDDIYTFTALNGYRYHDGEWSLLGIIPHGQLSWACSIPDVHGNPIFFGTTPRLPFLYISVDGGYEWSVVDNPPPHLDQMIKLYDVEYDPNRHRLWLNTPLGMMWEDAEAFVSVGEQGVEPPDTYQLLDVHPNPFNESTTITFQVKRPGNVTLTLYNTLGQEIQTLVEDTVRAGEHTVSVNASNFASGSYFLRLSSPDGEATRKIVCVK